MSVLEALARNKQNKSTETTTKIEGETHCLPCVYDKVHGKELLCRVVVWEQHGNGQLCRVPGREPHGKTFPANSFTTRERAARTECFPAKYWGRCGKFWSTSLPWQVERRTAKCLCRQQNICRELLYRFAVLCFFPVSFTSSVPCSVSLPWLLVSYTA